MSQEITIGRILQAAAAYKKLPKAQRDALKQSDDCQSILKNATVWDESLSQARVVVSESLANMVSELCNANSNGPTPTVEPGQPEST